MQNHKRMIQFMMAVFGIILSGCASHSAPRDWLPTPAESGEAIYGGWIEVREIGKRQVKGELIAISTEHIYVLTDSHMVQVPCDNIKRAQVTAFDVKEHVDELKRLTFLGTLSSLSHGLLAGLTGPLWIITGSAITGGYSYWPVVRYPKDPLEAMAKYARFPQGLPPGLDLTSIQPKSLRGD